MRNKKPMWALGLALLAVATAAWAIPPVYVGEVHEYYQDGQHVGWAQRDCKGRLTSGGIATEDVQISYLVCPFS
ncbi:MULTISPECIES: hypothetical protein [unclassified Lysobacter]|uniref:hypothetical protein n=1 Tax=unclassified Lysobacter TaxID=2635362 RepID=UPI000A5A815B|nr:MULTISPECIES: hypothetical protein [unclassified Lysobacter]